jgi:hypothetical protein
MALELIKAEEQEDFVKACISKYGYCAEHNYYYYRMLDNDPGEGNFASIDGKYGMLGQFVKETEEWIFISGILAPKEQRLAVFLEVLKHCLDNGKKFTFEADDELYASITHSLANSEYHAKTPRFELFWPIYDLQKWDGDKMSGSAWKKMRNVLNGFNKGHDVKVVDSSQIPKEQLLAILSDWVKKRQLAGYGCDRKDSNKAYTQKYINLINTNFRGMDMAKTLVVDGLPSTITCGWDIPNSDKGYYSAIGIYNYAFDGLGEAANMDDLKRLKEIGYKFVDFGGSSKPLLEFKGKFKYDKVYRTRTFSIVKR